MKLFVCLILSIAFSFVVIRELTAGSVEYLSNQSPEYMRTLSRNAATDAADAVNYNPAGVMKMQDGLFFNLGGQYVFKKHSAEDNKDKYGVNPDEYKSDKDSVIPNFYALYKQEKWAAFFGFTVPAGGGEIEFDGGSPLVRNAIVGGVYKSYYDQYYEATGNAAAALTYANTNGLPAGITAANNVSSLYMKSIYYGFTLGGGYKINDMFAVSLGGRFITASKKFVINGKTDIDPTADALTKGKEYATVDLDTHGVGGIIGLNISPLENLNIGLRYETSTKLEWDVATDGSTLGIALADGLGYKDGKTERKDLPSLIGLGVSYSITPELKASPSFTYYLVKQADWHHYDGTDTNNDYDNGFDAGIAVEYKVLTQLTVSAGYLYSKVGGNNKTWSDFEIALDSNVVALGAKYEVIPGLNVNLSFEWSIFKDSTTNYELSGTEQDITYTRDAKIIALGVEYKAL